MYRNSYSCRNSQIMQFLPQLSNFTEPKPQFSLGSGKKQLRIKCEDIQNQKLIDNKWLRQTDSTLNIQTPKNKKYFEDNIQTDTTLNIQHFRHIKFLRNQKNGPVYLVKHKSTGFLFAMKTITKSWFKCCQIQQQNKKMIENFIKQTKIQSFLDHPNIIKLYAMFDDAYKIYMIFELSCQDQLSKVMKNLIKLKQQSVSFLMREILQGVSAMHQSNLVHKDLRAQNIILNYGVPKISGFQSCSFINKNQQISYIKSNYSQLPQRSVADDSKIDIWSLGCLCYELLTSENPFKVKKQIEVFEVMAQKYLAKVGSPWCRDFIYTLLQNQTNKRLNVSMLVQHPFIKKHKQIQYIQQLCDYIKQDNGNTLESRAFKRKNQGIIGDKTQ